MQIDTPDGVPTAGGEPRRTLGRRPGLPTGRAVLGGLLVTLAALGTFLAANRAGHHPTTSYAVMVRPVAIGARLQPRDVELRTMTLDAAVKDQAFSDGGRLTGAVALAPLAPGQLVQAADVSLTTVAGGQTLPPAHEFSLAVPRDRTPPALRRGERVALLATYGSGPDATTLVTVQDATVLAYDDGDDGIGSSRTGRLTVSLTDPAAVIATAHAAQAADVTVIRATQAGTTLPAQYSRAAGKAAS